MYQYHKEDNFFGVTSSDTEIAVLIDISESNKERIDTINSINRYMLNQLSSNDFTKDSVFVSAVAFNTILTSKIKHQKVSDIIPRQIHVKQALGYTDTGLAVLKALELLQDSPSKKQLIVLITDGDPFDDDFGKAAENWEKAVSRVHDWEDIKGSSKVFLTLVFEPEYEENRKATRLKDISANKSHIISVSDDINDIQTLQNQIQKFADIVLSVILSNGPTPLDDIFSLYDVGEESEIF